MSSYERSLSATETYAACGKEIPTIPPRSSRRDVGRLLTSHAAFRHNTEHQCETIAKTCQLEPYRSWQSVCRFSLPFLLPLLVAASRCRLAKQNHCAVQYCRRRDCRCRRNRGVEIGFITHHSSFIIHLPLLTPRHPGSFQSGASVLPQSSVLSPQSCVFKLPVPAPVINCYFGESNPQLSIKSVCCAIGPCICPVFTGITVKMKRFWLQFGGVKSPGGAILPANRSCLVEFGKFGFSLFTDHCSLQSRCRLAKLIRSAAQYWSR